jgi:two-component system, chemotaxis family, protein-glutamate methylesterase/glutaminase
MHAATRTPVVDVPLLCRAVAIGASAGGIHALQTVLGALPADFCVPVVVVLHLQPRHESLLASVLGPRTSLRVKPAERGERLLRGTVYLGVPDLHLEVVDELVVLASTALVHFSRPSVDVLFRSMAANYGGAACGVVLSGAGRDGADGLAAIKAAGGTTIVQDPASAQHGGMPLAALAASRVDMTLAAEAIGPALVRRATAPSAAGA